MKDIAALFKIRLGFFVVMSAILGWFMAVETLDLKSFLLLTIGGYLLTGASNGLNQVIEKRLDGLMERTAERPLPWPHGTLAGDSLQCTGWYHRLEVLVYLESTQRMVGRCSIGFIRVYLYAAKEPFDPQRVCWGLPRCIATHDRVCCGHRGLRHRTWDVICCSVYVAIPAFLGHRLARPRRLSESWVPYAALRAGRTKESAWQILMYTAFCIPASLLPWALPTGSPMVGNIALSVAILCGIGFMIPAVKLYSTLDSKHARQLMFASFAYLPVVQIAYVIDKI